MLKQRTALVLAAVLMIGGGVVAVWNYYLRTSPPPMGVASVEKMAFPLPDKPSIAVLPFTNMSDDPKQEYFSDGITEDLPLYQVRCRLWIGPAVAGWRAEDEKWQYIENFPSNNTVRLTKP